MNKVCLAVLACAALCLCACDNEKRPLRPEPYSRGTLVAARESPIIPGGPVPEVVVPNPDEGIAYDIQQGQHLYQHYNCNGCHANGGGGSGPPLMEQNLTYGSAPQNIFDTIVKGRPHGMPSWGGRIPEYQIWQIVTYVRSLSGLESSVYSPGRTDNMESKSAAQLK